MATEALSEAEKIQKVPGIVFVDGAAGRRARIAGSGIDVFEAIKIHRSCGEDPAATAEALDSLTPDQLQAAFDYYAAFPEEIDQRLAEEEAAFARIVRIADLRRSGETLYALEAQGVRIPSQSSLISYLTRDPQLAAVIPAVCRTAKAALPEDAQLSLEIYRDAESDDSYLTLYVRQERYRPDILKRIDDVNQETGDLLAGCSAWMQVATDFRTPR